MDKKFLLEDSKQFCMFPWVHLFVTPKGDAYPCCSHSFQKPLGNVKSESMINIFNSDDLKKLRLDMLNSKPNKTCEFCYNFEENGGGSLRKYSREMFGKHFDDVVTSTAEDGSVPDFKLKYIDIRFNNICNFKCRTCGGEYSSQWAIEDYTKKKKLGGLTNSDNDFTILEADPTGRLLKETMSHLDHVDMVYFAGGEPMLSEEHYILLEEMIRLGRKDILLRYNTNASTLKFKNKDILELWSHFDRVEVSSSIDHYGERAEWIRHGTNWGEVETNLRLFRSLPNVNFQINTVLSVFNYLTLTDFYEYLVKNDFCRADDFHHYLVATPRPEFYSTTALPVDLKNPGTEKIKKYLESLKGTNFTRLMDNLKIALEHTNSANTWEANKFRFKEIVNELDGLRGENMVSVFPELSSLMD